VSEYSQDYLNKNTLIGNVDLRGNAWHHMLGTDNHFSGPVPRERVEKLIGFETIAVPLGGFIPATVETMTSLDDAGNPIRRVESPAVGIYHAETGACLGVNSESYAVHGFTDWLLDIDGPIGSAVLLKHGAVAYVQLDTGETMQSGSGVEILPFLAMATSLDGSMPTTAFTGNTRIVCDNTARMALQGAVDKYTLKHTKHSVSKKLDYDLAREQMAAAGKLEIEWIDTRSKQIVTGKQFDAFLDLAVPLPDKEGRGQTMAQNKRDILSDMYIKDDRVSPWKDTAFGVLQLMNTYAIHESTVRGDTPRLERNALALLKGSQAAIDAEFDAMLQSVLV
jgi:phage/plasmid-like protein (TIGR03299 family)